ncbi:hypothetical protein MSI_22420 [Treponema sp. JC4]|uniref:PrsW family glutamic-type intramembrane protease n=1 Tax=Treponema sp. JC4 TaxID=1124982 RepID=UPI00025B034D|nr:PrsW family glutamic-type intramembrane protease [Treponema sp. JC4]EID84300.1 hypothetical protein MSI_22420 [Treponema sp. JC4]
MTIALCFLPIIICFVIYTLLLKIRITDQLIAVLLGLIAVFPISLIQYFLPDFGLFENNPVLQTLLKSIIIYGLTEELIKMLFLIPIPHKKLSESDFLFLAFFMGLTLGCFESTVYFLDHLQKAASRGAQLLLSQIFIRIFTSDLIHMACTGLGGLFLYSCRNKPVSISVFILAVVLHGIYDFFAGFQNDLKYFSIAVIILAFIECRNKYVSLQNLCENRLTIFY